MPRLVAWVVRAAAVLAVLDIVDPVQHNRPPGVLDPAMDALVDGFTFATGMVSAGATLVLAGALQRRKRRAWVLMVVVVVAGSVAHLQARRWPVVATNLLTLVALLRPARGTVTLAADDEARLRDLLARYGGRDSLGYFALRGDKTAVFSATGKAAVVYRVVGSVSLASGDPLGDPEAWPSAIGAWLEEADDYAWTPGVVGASEPAAIAYRRAGLDSLELGDEAILELDEFSVDGRAMRGVRQAVNRVHRAGCTLDVRRQRGLSATELAEAVRTADALPEADVERGFSMALGRLGDPRDPDVVVARAREASGRLVAVLAFVPWGDDGLSLDLMRRAEDSDNGTVEFVVTGVVEAARAMGVRRISLNFAVFRSVFERGSRVGAGPVLRLWHRLLLVASKWWQIESLYRANVKYHPDWVPRFVCFRRAAELPRVVIAAAEAEAFIQRPRLRWLAP